MKRLNKEICGYTCAYEMNKLKTILYDLEVFSKFNPEHAKKVINDMEQLVTETKRQLEK